MASSLASALRAEKLILLTDVQGISDKKGTVITTLRKKDVKKLMDEGTVSGGMIPKVQACTQALDHGVQKTHIVDGRVAHCLLLEIFTKEGIGTEIVG